MQTFPPVTTKLRLIAHKNDIVTHKHYKHTCKYNVIVIIYHGMISVLLIPVTGSEWANANPWLVSMTNALHTMREY